MIAGFTGRVPAPAKVNLYLHVGPVRDDGRHPLDSLVVFAGPAGTSAGAGPSTGTGDGSACDWLDIRPAERMSLSVTGDGAAAAGPVADNLVQRTVDALVRVAPDLPAHAIALDKALPVAAGLGGGSADAGAVLRALGPLAGLDEEGCLSLGAQLGGDVPACVLAAACRMEGDGDRVVPVRGLPALPALLVNPRIPCPTGAVFAAFDRIGDARPLPQLASPDFARDGLTGTLDWLAQDTRNDLEAPACSLLPAISGVLEHLAGLPGARLVRMSGSGASCFALFGDMEAAFRAHQELRRQQPDWWARPVLLG